MSDKKPNLTPQQLEDMHQEERERLRLPFLSGPPKQEMREIIKRLENPPVSDRPFPSPQ